MFSWMVAPSSNGRVSASAAAPCCRACPIIILQKGMAICFRALASRAAPSGLALRASSTEASIFSPANAPVLASNLLTRASSTAALHPVKAPTVSSCTPVTCGGGPGGAPPLGFFLGGACFLAIWERSWEMRFSKYREASCRPKSGSPTSGQPELTMSPGLCSSFPQMCSQVCGQMGASTLAWSSMKRATRSACMPWAPHAMRYVSLAPCSSKNPTLSASLNIMLS
mmetsp:Transcript_14644/g.41602  ORF Transcript_14644/g.41602 Transcript_14644/m.41602 type:complete len:226 (-) Transcript_14644:2340-3017(-)